MKLNPLPAIVALNTAALITQAQTVDTVTTNGLFEPYGVAVDLSTNVYYLTDGAHNRLVRYDPATGQLSSLAASQLYSPQGIVLARGGLVVAEAGFDSISLVTFDGDVQTLAGGTRGSADGVGASAQFSAPAGLAADANGNIYVADAKNNAIRRLAPDNTVTTYATGFNEPAGVAVGEGGVLFVADTRNHVIKLIQPDKTIKIIAGKLGVSGSDDGLGPTAEFNGPRGLMWVGGETGLLVADSGNNSIRRLRPKTGSDAWVVDTFAGSSGPAGFVNGALNAAQFYAPIGLARDAEGAILVADLYNNALRRITRPAAPLPVVLPPGGTYSNSISITVTSAAPNTVIRYTTDGKTPTPLSSSLTGSLALTGGPVALQVRGFNPDLATSGTVSNGYAFFVSPLSVSVPGGSFTNDIDLAVATLTANAPVRFTTDGTAPTPTSPIWTNGAFGQTGPIIFGAFRDGFDPAPLSSNYFTFTVATPVLLPNGADTNNNVDVLITTDTVGAKLFYTLDGSEPTINSTPYDKPFSFGTSSILKVKGFKDHYLPSQTVTATFKFTVSDPVITPAGATADNPVPVEISSATAGAQLYWTIDGSDPTPANGTLYTSKFTLGTNGVLKARAFKTGYTPSGVSSATFNLIAATPVINPAGATAYNPVTVTLGTATAGARLYWSIDGSDPTIAHALYTAPFTLATNGTLKVVAIKDGFVDSPVVSADFHLSVAPPTVSPNGGTTINSVSISMSSDTTDAGLRYTLDGSEPTESSALYAGPLTLTTNATLKAAGFRNGFLPSQVTRAEFRIQVDTPRMIPASGFFPNGTTVTLSVTRPDAVIYYTLSGQDPTPNDFKYTGPFQLNALSAPGQDLRVLKARAFAPGAEPSDVVSGQPVQENALGVPRDAVAGIGSTIMVPVVVNLQTNRVLRSVQFRVQVAPTAPAVPSLTSELRALNISSNDFIQVVGPGDKGGVATLSVSAYRDPGPGGVFTNGLNVYALGTNANFGVRDFATVAMLAVPIPPAANEGDTYRIDVVAPSGTSDGQQGPIPLTPLASRTITVKNIPYLVGDSSPSGWYNAGDFGNGDLDNADVNNAFYASLGIRVPFSFTDVFDAMDTFPDDVAGAVGGDGQIRYLDWQRILNRSLRHDPNNWQRAWTKGGVRIAVRTNLPPASASLQSYAAGLTGQLWQPQAQVGAVSKGDVQPGSVVKVPVFVRTTKGAKLAGLQFRAVIKPQGDAPTLQEPARFEQAEGLPAPLQPEGLPNEQVATAWSPLLNPLVTPLENSNHVGYLSFVVPASAPSGSSYAISFANADGAPDLDTQYDFTTSAAGVWVQTPAGSSTDSAQPVNGFKLGWFAAQGTRYTVESTTDLVNGKWVPIANLVGSGRNQEYIDTETRCPAKFYRIVAHP
jgi:streptogramin lyase